MNRWQIYIPFRQVRREHNVSHLQSLIPSFFRDELEFGLTACGYIEDEPLGWPEGMTFMTLVVNPLLDLLAEYRNIDADGAYLAAEQMIHVLEQLSAEDEEMLSRAVSLIRHAGFGPAA